MTLQTTCEPLNQALQILDDTQISAYSPLNHTNATAEQVFLQNPRMRMPEFEYGKLRPETIARNLRQLNDLREKLPAWSGELGAARLHLIEVLLDSSYRTNHFLQTVIDYQQSCPDDKIASAEAYRQANLALYGPVDENIFWGALSYQLGRIPRAALCEEDLSRYQWLRAQLGEIKSPERPLFWPQAKTITAFRQLMEQEFAHVFRHLPPRRPGTFSAPEVCDCLNAALREFPGTQYRAIVTDEVRDMDVNHQQRLVKIPAQRAKGDLAWEDLCAKTFAHELCTHIGRATTYEHHPVTALSQEMPDYETFEEGVATCAEGAFLDTYELTRPDRYVNIGLASLQGRDFREVFELQCALTYLGNVNPKATAEERQQYFQKVQHQTFNEVRRAFRGTGDLPNHKDLCYTAGSLLVWQLIEENIDERPHELFRWLFQSGKTNWLNPEQRQIIADLESGALQF